MGEFTAICKRLIRELDAKGSGVLTEWLPKIAAEAKSLGVQWSPGLIERKTDEVCARLYDPLAKTETRYWLFPVVKPSDLFSDDPEVMYDEYRQARSERLPDIVETVRAWIACARIVSDRPANEPSIVGTASGSKRRAKPRMTRHQVQDHWQEVMRSGNRDLIQDYLTMPEMKLKDRIGCSRGTLRACEGFKERSQALRLFNQENG